MRQPNERCNAVGPVCDWPPFSAPTPAGDRGVYPWPQTLWASRRLALHPCDRQLAPEDAASFRGEVGAGAAAVVRRELPDDRQAEAVALLAARRPGRQPAVFSEQFRPFRLRNAGAAVGDGQAKLHRALRRCNGNANTTAARRELDRVGDQVCRDLENLRRVAANRRQLVRRGELERLVLEFGRGEVLLDDRGGQRGEVQARGAVA